jgi:hypothetical protein
MPIAADFATIGAVFANHHADMQSVGRGGDLWIRYPDGTLKNLTAAAGYGSSGLQGANAIAVRDPAVSWDGSKAIFSMVVGAPRQQYDYTTHYWQLYEITNFGIGHSPSAGESIPDADLGTPGSQPAASALMVLTAPRWSRYGPHSC